MKTRRIDAVVAGDRVGGLFLVGGLDELVDQAGGERVSDSEAGRRCGGAESISKWVLPVSESSIRQSGSLFLAHSRLVRLLTRAGVTLGLAE